MEPPAVWNTIVDGQRNVTYHIMAHRPLTQDEMIAVVRDYRAQPKVRRRARPLNAVIKITTAIGAAPA